MYNKRKTNDDALKINNCARTHKKGITLIEVLIGAGVLSLFMAGLFTLYSGGQRLGSQSFWTQQTVNRLRNACRHISENIKKSSYPSTIIYPGTSVENTSDDFKLKYNSKGIIFATETADVAGAANPGTYLFQFAESAPERQQFETDTAGRIKYHIYSLSSSGKLLHHLFVENAVVTVAPEYAKSLSKPTFPPDGAALENSSVIAENVESVSVRPQIENAVSPITVSITCRYPKGETRRVEETTAVPNVANLKQTSGSGTW